MSVLIFDCETTGVKEPRLVEAAWVRLSPGPTSILPLQKFSQRYNPGVPIECGAMATHHIMDEDVRDCPPASEFTLPADTAYLIGHNIDFDWEVACSCGPQPTPKRICTLALARHLWPDADSHSLAALAYRLDPPRARILCPHAHGAEADVQLVRVILLFAILAQLKPSSWEALWEISERARIPVYMPFGKYRDTGIKIVDIPRDYKAWLLRQDDVDPYLQLALRR
ncbi:MAG: exonuclease domain-containing protein [Candidatus Methylomirabilales bacterium]